MTVGDRVRLNDGETFPKLGTITKVSPAGYVSVRWDQEPIRHAMYSPRGAVEDLTVVIGRDALPRHDWSDARYVEPSCYTCGLIQTEENDLEPCAPKETPSICKPLGDEMPTASPSALRLKSAWSAPAPVLPSATNF